MNKELQYPEGCFIEWCGEYYKVLNNYFDYSGRVKDMSGLVFGDFYFTFDGEKAKLVTDPVKIKELEGYLEKYKMKNDINS